MVTSFSRGHRIYFRPLDDSWRYEDNDETLDGHRPCAFCGRNPTPEGFDACLGYVEGATSACCGHGMDERYQIMR